MPTEHAVPTEDPAVGRRVPLTILTGFLGAGKTTLLNRLLTSDHGRRVAVLVNDFGSVNIDADLVVGVEDNMMSLANGCVCCEIRDDLLESVEQLVTMDDPPDHIVLEASGVADPSSIWATFAGSQHPEWLRLDGVICVVDGEQLFARLDEAPDLLMLKARQIGFADLVVLNKVDLAGPAMVDYIRQWLDKMMDRVRVVDAIRCDVPLDVLLGAGREERSPDLPTTDDRDHAHEDHLGGHDAPDHRAQFSTFTFETEAAFDPVALREMVSRRLPASVYRCKGFVRVDDGRMMVLQAVGRRTELTPSSHDTGPSRLVAIGTADLDEAELRAEFDACLA